MTYRTVRSEGLHYFSDRALALGLATAFMTLGASAHAATVVLSMVRSWN